MESVSRSLDDNEAKRGDEALSIRDSIATDDFLALLQGVTWERDPDFSLVVIDLADYALLTTE